jgi:hypothetical protein
LPSHCCHSRIRQRLKEFKQFELDDEAFWEKVIGGAEPEVPVAVKEGGARLTAGETSVVVSGEVVDSIWEEDFATLEDQEIVADLRDRMKQLGLDPSAVEDIVRRSKPGAMTKRPAAENFPIQPQRALEQARKRVYEQGSRLARILLNNTGLEITGRELPYRYTSLGLTGKSNLIAAVTMVNNEFNKRLGKERNQCAVEDFKKIMDSLDDVLQMLVRRVKKAQSEYEKRKA